MRQCASILNAMAQITLRDPSKGGGLLGVPAFRTSRPLNRWQLPAERVFKEPNATSA